MASVRVVDRSIPPGVESEHSTDRDAAANLLAVARALESKPIPAPPSE